MSSLEKRISLRPEVASTASSASVTRPSVLVVKAAPSSRRTDGCSGGWVSTVTSALTTLLVLPLASRARAYRVTSPSVGLARV